jgi:Glycosyltransferase 61
MINFFKKIANQFHKALTSIVIYRDLTFFRVTSKYPASSIFFFGQQIPISISEPDFFHSELSPQIQGKLGVYSPIRKYCDIFENVSILGGDHPIALNSRNRPLWNTVAYELLDFEKYYTPIKWFIQSNSSSQCLDEEYAIFLYSVWSSNYFHWLLDNLARLQVLDFVDKSVQAKTKILVGGKLSSFQLSALQSLGLKNIEYIERNNYNVKNLLVPNFPLAREGYDLDQIIWLKDKIIANTKNIKLEFDNTKILVLRKPASKRIFLNQEEILNALIPLGFKSLYLEELSFEQQVQLFRQADCIVAAHGAGLANIIFSEAATIIEIFAGEIFPCYFQLSKTLGLNYCYLQCNNEQLTGRDKDLMVDVALLLSLIPT